MEAERLMRRASGQFVRSGDWLARPEMALIVSRANDYCLERCSPPIPRAAEIGLVEPTRGSALVRNGPDNVGVEQRPTARDLEILRLFGDGQALSKKQAAELSGLSYNTVAARINRLQSQRALRYVPHIWPMLGRHPLEQAVEITAKGLQYLEGTL